MSFKHTIKFLVKFTKYDKLFRTERIETIMVLKKLLAISKRRLADKVITNTKARKIVLKKSAKGKVLIITPKNSPFVSIIFLSAVSAIAGNETYVRPPTKYRTFAKKVVRYLNEDLKRPLIKIVSLSGEKAVDFAVKNKFDQILFMGRYAIGKTIWEKCIENGIDYVGNHEGKSSAIILESAKNIGKIKLKLIQDIIYKDGLDCDSTRIVYCPKKFFENFKILKNVSVIRYRKISNIINEINDDEFTGLSISVWGNKKKALSIANKIKSGRVVINKIPTEIDLLTPWGGIKKSSNSNGMQFWEDKFTFNKLIEINNAE